MTDEEEIIKAEAIIEVKQKRAEIIEKFASLNVYVPVNNPFTIFMAGCPGAGKTEFSIALKKEHQNLDEASTPVLIDADAIRPMLSQFKGNNSHVVQAAASIGVEKLFDYVQKKHLNVIVDGTFSHPKSLSNIKRAVDKKRKVAIMYLYQTPLVAWNFTKKREVLEGRNIPVDAFIESYNRSKQNVLDIKKEYGKSIELHLVIKNYENKTEKTHFNVDNIDSYIKNEYTTEQLKELLK